MLVFVSFLPRILVWWLRWITEWPCRLRLEHHWHLYNRFFSGFTGSGIKALGCQFTGPVCLWREVLKSRTGWRSLLYLESKVRCFAFNIWRLQLPYMTLKFKGHRPLEPAFEKSKPCCILNMSPVIRSVTDIVFLYFTKQILHNSDTKDCREQIQICHCTVVLIKLLEALYG